MQKSLCLLFNKKISDIYVQKKILPRYFKSVLQKIKLQRKVGEALTRNKKIYSAATVLLIFALLFSNEAFFENHNAVQAIQTNEEKKVAIGGMPFGIKLFTNGVMVIKLDDVKTGSETCCPAKDASIKINDVITKINDENVTSNEQVMDLIENSNGSPITLTIRRNQKTLTTELKTREDSNGHFRAGMWIKDSGAGIGTITYFDTETNSFAALGHGICDSDTNSLLPLKKGEILPATITSVTKSTNGKPGSLNGYFENETLGNVLLNNELGVYGKIEGKVEKAALYQMADKTEIRRDKAKMICTIDESGPKEYDINIISVRPFSNSKSLVIEVTDETLLQKTGGIIQGMSGSPIIQNGKLVGAVTHVFVNDTTKGYGVMAIDMAENYSKNVK